MTAGYIIQNRGNAMKRILAALPLVFMLMLVGCGSSTILTGQWVDDAEINYIFDGTNGVQIGKGDVSMSCKYEITPDNEDKNSLTGRLKITITPQEGKETVTEGSYTLNEDKTTLTINGDDGSKQELKKAQ